MDDIQFTHIKNVIIFSESVNHLFDCNFFTLSNPLMTNLFVNWLFMWLRRMNIDGNTLWNTFTLKKLSLNVYHQNSLCAWWWYHDSYFFWMITHTSAHLLVSTMYLWVQLLFLAFTRLFIPKIFPWFFYTNHLMMSFINLSEFVSLSYVSTMHKKLKNWFSLWLNGFKTN